MTNSANFPTKNGFQSACGNACVNSVAFVSKLTPSGKALVYSTYLGGNGGEDGQGIAVDGAGAAYVVGKTNSTNFPTQNAFQGACGNTGCTASNAFVTKLNAAGNALLYSTYLGGDGAGSGGFTGVSDVGDGIAADGAGNAYVTGQTYSTNFPTRNALQSSCGSAGCAAGTAFVTKLNTTASGAASLVYSTYLGGSAGDQGYGIAADGAGAAYITGYTASPDFPTANALQSVCAASGCGTAFVTKLNAAGNGLVYSTYLGNNASAQGNGIALDGVGAAYVTGFTYATNFPTQNALQSACGNTGCTASDAFVTKLVAASSGAIPWHGRHDAALGGGLNLSVDLSDGHVDLSTADLRLPGRGPDLAVGRVWDSSLAQAGITSTAGQGWASSLTPSMSGALTGTVRYLDRDGTIWPFVYTGSLSAPPPYTSYYTPPGLPWQLVTSSAGYTLTNILTSEVWAFDSQGRLTGDTDAYGNKVGYSYGAGSSTSPSSVVNSGGRAALLAYANGQLADVQSPLWTSSGGAQGQHVTYGYTGGQFTSLTRGAGTGDAVTTTFGYSGTQLVTITTPANRAWGIGYDASGRVSAITSPVSGTAGQPGYTPAYTTQYTYNPGQTVVVAGVGTSAAVTTTYTLDGQGQAVAVADGLGHTSHSSYDADHDVTTSTDATGNTTTNKYQYIGPNGAVGQLVEEDQPAIQAYSPLNGVMATPVITHSYDPTTHDLLATGQPEGGLTRYTYDGHHSVVATSEQTTQNTCATTCPTTWQGTLNQYDQYGERTATTDGRGVSVDANGNAMLADPNGQYSSHTSYDALGDTTSSSTPPLTTTLNGITTTAPVTSATTYDADGNATTTTDANGAQTTDTYDHLGRPVATGRPAVTLWDGSTPATTVTTATVDDSAQGANGASVDQFSYAGNWGHCANCGPTLYGRSNSWDATANDAATLAFSGTAVALYAVKDVNNGIAAVSLDGGAETLVDLYATARTYNVLVWSSGTLAAGRHTLKLRVTGSKNASSSGYYVGPDRADIGVPSAPAGTTSYDAVGNVVSSADANGATTTSSYDPMGRQVSTTNPVSGTMLMTYTADELTAQRDPQGNVTGYGYDAAGRQIQTTNPVTGAVQAAYDAAGNTLAVTTTDRTNGNAAVTLNQMGYDALNRVITDTVVTNTANIAGSALTTLTRYDQDGNVAQTQQPNGDVVYDVYDAADRLTNVEIDPAPLSKQQAATHPSYEAYGYDAAGNQTFAQDADNRATTTQYDGDNRLTQSVAASTAPTGTTTITTTLGYDPNGNTLRQTTQTVDSTSPGQVQTHTATSTYNAADWETSSSDDSLTTSYSYDAAGQQRTESSSDALTNATMSYDAAGRVTAIAENAGGAGPYTTQYAYNQNDLPTQVTLPGGVTESAGYDPNSALTSLLAQGPNTGATTTTLNTAYGYGYNAAGWTTSTTTISGTDTIAHDGAGRLTSDCGQQPIVRNTTDHCYRWTYDTNGNVTSQVADTGATEVYTYSQSQSNALLRSTFLQANIPARDQYKNTDTYYAYDGHGDTTAITSPVNGAYTDPAAINDRLQYDAQERPITITHLEGGVPITISLGYNADGLRARYTVVMSGTVINDERFQYRDGSLAQVSAVTATLNTNGSVKSQGLPYTDTYIYGPGGEPLEFLRQQNSVTSRYWYALDGQGSVVAVTDSTGKVVDRYTYDSWGEQVGRYPELVPQQLRYAGYWYDSELEWYWLTTRYYNPEDLRFLQPDPSDLDGVHTYAYAGDDPIDLNDPAGLDFWSDTFGCSHWYDQFNPLKPYCIAYQEYQDFKALTNPNTPGLEKALIVVSYVPLPGEAVATKGARVVFAIFKGGRTVKLAGRAAEVAVRRGRYVTVPYKGVRAFLRGAKACARCFPAGTRVATPDGEQAIQTIRVGQHVLAEDPTTGRVEAETVQAVLQDPVSDLLAVDLADGSAITVTADHPFWVDGGLFLHGSGWLEAGQLQPGDRLRTARGQDAVVAGLRQHVGRAVVYTLTVAHDHTFFVGTARVLVHNAGICFPTDPGQVSHIFRNAPGHVNPTTVASRERFAQLFLNVASDSANEITGAARARFLPSAAIAAGVRVFAQTTRSGKQIWVFVRNDIIQDAGVNLIRR